MTRRFVAVVLFTLVSVACTSNQATLDIDTTLVSTTTTTSVAPAETGTTSDPAVTSTLPPGAANPGWRQLQAVPLAGRIWHSTTWTGRELIVWGGVLPTTGASYDDGAIFDTSEDEWRLMPLSPLEGRVGHTAVWTGGEVIVWGGHSGGTGGKPTRRFSDGAAFQPSTDTWRATAKPDLAGGPGYASVWTGSEMIVIGGNDGNQSFAEVGLNEAGAYDPSTDTWRALEMPVELTVLDAMWTGTEVVVYGVERYLGQLVGVSLDPATGNWRQLPTAPVHPAVPDIDRVGDEILAWSYDPEEDGIAVLDIGTLAWRDLPPFPGQPTDGIPNAAAVGPRETLMQSETVMAIYTDESKEWRLIDTPTADIGPFTVQPVWTGTDVLFFYAGIPPGDPNALHGIPAQFWVYNLNTNRLGD